MSVAENLRVPLLYTVNARGWCADRGADVDERCMELLRLVGLDHKAKKLAAAI